MLLLFSVFLTLWVPCVHGQGRTCDFPQINHGAINDENRYKQTFPVATGKHFYYSCHQNFVSPSQKPWTQITCTEDGWQPTPNCLRQCFLAWVENGQSEASGQTHLEGATVKITCDAGYSLPNSQSSITCGERGWSAQPVCRKPVESCDFPEIKHGDLYTPWIKPHFPAAIGKSYYYKCDENFIPPTNTYWGKITCTKEGWSPEVPCLRTCSKHLKIENGFFSEIGNTHISNEAQYRCKPGYLTEHGKESGSITCLEDGWSPTPKCIKSCDAPVFVNARDKNAGTWFKLNDQLEYECDNGYESKTGNTTGSIVCGDTGWSDQPVCYDSKKKCGTPPPIDNGDITSSPLKAYVPGSTVEYQCQNLYRLKGSAIIKCHDGQWSEPPKCLEPCVVSEEIMNKHKIQLKWVNEKKLYLPSGDFVEFSCKKSYRHIPPESFRTQCIEGKLIYPTCG